MRLSLSELSCYSTLGAEIKMPEPISACISTAAATVAKLLDFNAKVKDGKLQHEIYTLIHQLNDELGEIRSRCSIRKQKDKIEHKNEDLWEGGVPVCWTCAY